MVTLTKIFPLTFKGLRSDVRFPLLRYYTIASIIVITVVAASVNYAFTKIERTKLIEITERRAIQEANHLITLLSYQPGLHEPGEPGLSLQFMSRIPGMDTVVQDPNITPNIALFSVLDSKRRVVYSTFPMFRGKVHDVHPGFDLAIAGRVAESLVDMPTDKLDLWWPPTQPARAAPQRIGSSELLVEIYTPIYAELHEKENPIGVLKTYHYLNEPGALQKGAQDYLSKGQVDAPLLVRSIRYAIERKLLENQLVQANASLSRTNQEIEALFTMASILVEPGEFESKATKVMDRLAELTGAEWVTLRMQRGAEPGLQLVAAAGSAVSSSPPMPVLTDQETLAYRALREGVLIVVNDYPSEPNASPNIVALEMKSMALIPIKAGDQSLGLVNVLSRKPNHFTPDLVRLLSAITDEIGVLLENASLAQQVKDKTVELESFNVRLARLVEERTAELESFSYSVSHDLRSPLRSINGFGQALYEDYSEQLDDQGKDYLERVRSSTQKMELLIDGLLELSRLSRSEIRTREIDLSELARSIAVDLVARDPARDVAFSIQDEMVVNGDPGCCG